MASRWLITLDGDSFDTEDFVYWFPSGDVYCINEDGKVYLAGPSFDRFSTASEAYKAAKAVLEDLYGAIAVVAPEIWRPTIGCVYEVLEDGKRRGNSFISGSIEMRSKGRGHLVCWRAPVSVEI